MLTSDVQIRCRTLIKQVCVSEDVKILKEIVSKDHVHMLIENNPSLKICYFVQRVKSRTSKILQTEYPVLQKQYFGKLFWGIGYCVWSAVIITEEVVKEYLEYHKDQSNYDYDIDTMILEGNNEFHSFLKPVDFQSIGLVFIN